LISECGNLVGEPFTCDTPKRILVINIEECWYRSSSSPGARLLGSELPAGTVALAGDVTYHLHNGFDIGIEFRRARVERNPKEQ
jgi:hypothetical protein